MQEALCDPNRRVVTAALTSMGSWATLHQGDDAPPPPRETVEGVAGLVALRSPNALPEASRLAGTLARNGHGNETTERWLTAGVLDDLPEMRFAVR